MTTINNERLGIVDHYNFTDALFHYVAGGRPQDAPNSIMRRQAMNPESWFAKGVMGPGLSAGKIYKATLTQKQPPPPVEPSDKLYANIKRLSLFPSIYSKH